jgi:ABC-type sugar transport system substrate-binding protein
MTSRRLRATALLTVLASTVLAGCGSSGGGSDDADALQIGVMIYDTQLPFAAPLQDSLRAKAEELGADIDILDGQGDSTREAQVIQQFVTQRKDVILAMPSDADAIVPAAQLATEAGVPVLALSNEINDPDARVTYVGVDNVGYGSRLAEAARQVAGDNARVAVIMGELGSSAERDRTEGIAQYMSEHPGMTMLAQQSANWDNAQALQIGQDLLSKYPEGAIDVIIGEGPETAAAARYAAQAGRTDVQFVVGDVSKDVAAALHEGAVAAAVFQDPYDLGQRALADAVAVAKGEEVPDPDMGETQIFTAEQADSIPEHSLF